MNNHYQMTIKDIIIILISVLIIIADMVSEVVLHGFNGLGVLIERAIVVLLAYVGFVQIANYLNWIVFVPDFISHEEYKRTKRMIDAYYHNDINFFHDYDKERIDHVMAQLGITAKQFEKIKIDLIKMRCLPLSNLEDCKNKIKHFIKSGPPLLVDQKTDDNGKFNYPKVRFYINFVDAMFWADYLNEISSILVFFIKDIMNETNIDKVVIPWDSNFLLGVEVGKKLGLPVVKMRPTNGKIYTAQYWDGHLGKQDRVIIVHDVLVEGTQIVDALEKLPTSCDVKGIYCLVARKEWEGIQVIEEKKIPLEYIMSLDDNDIAKIIEE